MKLKYCILSLLFFYLNISSIQAVIPQMEVSPDERGVSSLVFQGAGNVPVSYTHLTLPTNSRV